jgi:hypothetical protein
MTTDKELDPVLLLYCCVALCIALSCFCQCYETFVPNCDEHAGGCYPRTHLALLLPYRGIMESSFNSFCFPPSAIPALYKRDQQTMDHALSPLGCLPSLARLLSFLDSG